MATKPRLTFWQIWNMSFGFFGIQFGFGLQNANVSRIFQTLGADIDNIPILWIAAPVTGLIIQPIIGHMSDRTWTKLGRRRPYFLAGALLASIALILMPNSPSLWIAAGMLWIMDASINISMEPFRAFVGDNLPDDQRTMGFTMQSFFIGIGAFVSSYLPYILDNWFGITNIAPKGIISDSVKLSFYIGGAVFLFAVLWTVFFSKEYSPEQLKQFESETHKSVLKHTTIVEKANKYYVQGTIWLISGIILSLIVLYTQSEKELYVLTFGISFYGVFQIIAGLFVSKNHIENGLVSIITDLYRMPVTMKQLALVQFFSWFALFSMWIYATAAITSHLYNTSDTSSELYNAGANWVGAMFAWYNLFAAVFSLTVMPWIAKKTNRKLAHIISLIAGGVGLISLFFIQKPDQMVYSMVGIGLAWAGILSMPYAILTGALPQHKMGVYMGIFNFFIVIPQIVAATILGFMVKILFDGQAIYAMVTGGISLLIAAFLVVFVKDIKTAKPKTD